MASPGDCSEHGSSTCEPSHMRNSFHRKIRRDSLPFSEISLHLTHTNSLVIYEISGAVTDREHIDVIYKDVSLKSRKSAPQVCPNQF